MTLSTARGTAPSVDEIILSAYQQCGVMSTNEGYSSPQWSGRVAFGRRRLDAIIDELATSGGVARSAIFYDLTLTSGTYKYDLPTYALDLVGDGMYIAASEVDITKANSETLVGQVALETWHSISSKSSTGTPTIMACYRANSPPQVWFWPIPDEAGTVRLRIYRLSSDTYEGDKNMDLKDYWVEYITFRLSHVIALANSLPINLCGMLAAEAESLRKRARSYSADHTGSQIYVTHGRRC